jgi:tetratricopeptide (TPR) repeat protein
LLDAGRESSDIYNLQSWCFHKQGKLKEAVRAMDQAIDLDPKRETNYLDLGKILIEHKRYSVALEAAKKAIEVAPSSYQAYQLKGQAQVNLSLFAEAVKSYQRAVELNPKSSDVLLTLALAQSAEGLAEEAVATFEKAIKQFPQDPKLYQEYGRTLLIPASASDAVDESRAVTLLEKALSLDDSLPESHFELGTIALKKGNMEGALRHLRRAAQLNPNNSQIHYVLSRAYRRLGSNEEASKELQIYEKLEREEDKANQKTAPGAMSRGNKQE